MAAPLFCYVYGFFPRAFGDDFAMGGAKEFAHALA
jgi:hypothetical protein